MYPIFLNVILGQASPTRRGGVGGVGGVTRNNLAWHVKSIHRQILVHLLLEACIVYWIVEFKIYTSFNICNSSMLNI